MRTELKIEPSDGRGLEEMTSPDYPATMRSVRVAELKAKLSEYLRLVRKGHPVTVLDRETPIARIVPIEGGGSELKVRMPTTSVPYWNIPLPPPYKGKTDIVELLLEERQPDR
jgi:prevent-host-death family protein